MYNGRHNKQHTTKGKTMLFKLINLVLAELITISNSAGDAQFRKDLDDAIKAMKKIKKYL
jgi:hypothetical protein